MSGIKCFRTYFMQEYFLLALISKMPGLDYVTSRWNTMTATAFEKEWKMRNTDKKMHLINLIQVGRCMSEYSLLSFSFHS